MGASVSVPRWALRGALALAILCGGVRGYLAVPDTTFVLSCLTVDYSQGFVRRGLVGQLLVWLPGSVSTQTLSAASAVLALASAAACWILTERLLALRTTPAAALAVVVATSPAVVPMLASQRRLEQVGLVVAIALCVALVKGRTTWPVVACAFAMPVAVVIHEASAVLFLPVCLVMIAQRARRPLRVVALFALPSCVATGAVALVGRLTPAQAALLARAKSPLLAGRPGGASAIYRYLADDPITSLHQVLRLPPKAMVAMVALSVLLFISHGAMVRAAGIGGWSTSRGWPLVLLGAPFVAYGLGTDWIRWAALIVTGWLLVAAVIASAVGSDAEDAATVRLPVWTLPVGVYLMALGPAREMIMSMTAVARYVFLLR